MANFTLNITPVNYTPPVYTAKKTVAFVEEACIPITFEKTIGIIGYNPISLLESYTGEPWKELVITGITYTSQFLWGLEHNVTSIGSSQLPYTINISSVLSGQVIPTFKAIAEAVNLDIVSIRIFFYIKDINNLAGPNVSTTFQVQKTECPPNPVNDPTITITLATPPSGGCSNVRFRVDGLPNTTYKYQILTVSNGNHGYNATLQNTDTSQFITPAQISGTGNSINGTITTNGSGLINLEYQVCAKPTLRYPDANCVTVNFILFKQDGITLSTTERISLSVCDLDGF